MEPLSRRHILALGSVLAMAPAIRAADPSEGLERLPLWPGSPPGNTGAVIRRRIEERSSNPASHDRWVYGVDRPELVVFRPRQANGAAMLVIPGGSYVFLAYDNEGVEQARWLNALGVTVFVLRYRLPGEGWAGRADVPLQDAQRAMRLIRRNAAHFGIDGKRVGALGFSAGGHLCGSLATRHAEKVYAPIDEADGLPARPDVAGLVYPVVSLSEPWTHGGSRDSLLGVPAADELRRSHSVERRVDDATPPLFLIHAADDGAVPVENSIALYRAMLDRHRPAEMHLFEEGGHGFGTRLPAAMPAAEWPRLFARFAARKGLFPAAAV